MSVIMIVKRFRCLNCGHRFECDVLTKEEISQRQNNNLRSYPIHCPECGRTDIRDGWE